LRRVLSMQCPESIQSKLIGFYLAPEQKGNDALQVPIYPCSTRGVRMVAIS
jgi:hypothetical protein